MNDFFKDMSPAEINAYKRTLWFGRIIAIFTMVISLGIIPTIVHFLLGYWIVTLLAFAGVLFMSKKYGWLTRSFRQTNSGEILVLERALAEQPIIAPQIRNTPSEPGAIEVMQPLRGFFATRPASMTLVPFWWGVRERINILNEIVISSSKLPQEAQTYPTSDDIALIVVFQINVSVLQNAKWTVNKVRYPQNKWEEIVREQVVSYVVTKLRAHIAKHPYKDITVESLRKEFVGILGGPNTNHNLELNLAAWSASPQLISFLRVKEQQDIAQQAAMLAQAMEKAEKMFKADSSTSLAVYYGLVAGSMGLKVPDVTRQIHITGDKETIKNLGAGLPAIIAGTGTTTK